MFVDSEEQEMATILRGEAMLEAGWVELYTLNRRLGILGRIGHDLRVKMQKLEDQFVENRLVSTGGKSRGKPLTGKFRRDRILQLRTTIRLWHDNVREREWARRQERWLRSELLKEERIAREERGTEEAA